MGDEEKNELKVFSIQEKEFSEPVLEMHENVIKSLQERLEVIRPITRLIQKREEIVKERKEVGRKVCVYGWMDGFMYICLHAFLPSQAKMKGIFCDAYVHISRFVIYAYIHTYIHTYIYTYIHT